MSLTSIINREFEYVITIGKQYISSVSSFLCHVLRLNNKWVGIISFLLFIRLHDSQAKKKKMWGIANSLNSNCGPFVSAARTNANPAFTAVLVLLVGASSEPVLPLRFSHGEQIVCSCSLLFWLIHSYPHSSATAASKYIHLIYLNYIQQQYMFPWGIILLIVICFLCFLNRYWG